MNIDAIVARYIQRRDEIKAREAEHKKDLAPLKQEMELIENALMKHLQDQGATSLKTGHGTPYISEVESIKIVDREAVLDTVAEQGAWDVLNVSVAKKNYRESGIELPGIEINTMRKLNIRRS